MSSAVGLLFNLFFGLLVLCCLSCHVGVAVALAFSINLICVIGFLEVFALLPYLLILFMGLLGACGIVLFGVLAYFIDAGCELLTGVLVLGFF